MHLISFLVILTFSILRAFGALVPEKGNEVSTASAAAEEVLLSQPIFMLPPEIFLMIESFFTAPFQIFPPLCKHFNEQMEYMKDKQKKLLQSRTTYPYFSEIKWSISLGRLLKLDKSILNEFFYDYLATMHCFKAMDMVILYHSILKFNDVKTSSVNEIKEFADRLFQQSIDQGSYEYIESLIIDVYQKHNLVIDGNFFIISLPVEMIKTLYEGKKKQAIKYLIKQRSYGRSTISCIFNTQTSMDDLTEFLEDAQYGHWIFEAMQSAMLEPDLELTSQEKEFIFNRNQQFLAKLSSIESFRNHTLLAEVCNIVRYSEFVDNEAIVEKYFSVTSGLFYTSTETVAIAALLAGNLNLFLKMYQIRCESKFTVEFYKIVASSQMLMDLLPDKALINCFQIPDEYCANKRTEDITLDLTLRLEVLARKNETECDLDFTFSGDELGKVTAMAFYFPLEHLINRLSTNMLLICPIVEKCLLYSSKARNVLNKPAHILLAILQFSSEITSQVREMLFEDNLEFMKMLVDPENSDILNDFCFLAPEFYLSDLFSALLADSSFRNNLASPHAVEIRRKLLINLRDIFRANLLANEIAQLLGVFGLEIGNFYFDLLKVETNAKMALLNLSPIGTVEDFNEIDLDKLLTLLALDEFKRQKNVYEREFNMNLLLLDSFGVFQVWRERNLKTFKQFAPKEIDDIFEERIARFKATKFDK